MVKLLRGFFITALCAVFLINPLLPLPAAAAGGIRVYVDKREVAFEVPPFIEDGRTLVPLRAIMENMRAAVDWDGTRGRISVTDGQLTVIMHTGSNLALVNNRPAPLEIPPKIVNGRTFVPLRFLSESLGYAVIWENQSKTAYIFTDASAVTGIALQENLSQAEENIYIYGVKLGDGTGRVKDLLGEAQRVDKGTYGVDWWIYNGDLLNYLQVGIKDGLVTALYSCGLEWNFAGISPGDTRSRLAQKFNLEHNLQFTYDGADFLIKQTDKDLLENPLVLEGEHAAVFYCDVHDGGKIVAIFLTNRETLLKRGGLSYSYRYDPRRPPDLAVPSLSAAQGRDAAAGAALQMLDLVNSARLRRGLPLLAWHPEAAAVAREHSREMYSFGYFAHVSVISGKSHSDRLRDAGIAFLAAGENIAFGQPDAFCAHAGLMNSKGHRQNMLHEDFTHLGTGVVGEYYTQNFLIPLSSR